MSRRIDFDGLIAEAGSLLGRPGRHILAIAGAPGSGKSTTVDRLARAFDLTHPGQVAILPMDGYHFDDAVLRQASRLPWKGAPDTFDVGGLASTLSRLVAGTDTVAVPVFDRALEISRGSARLIGPEVRLILCEGNYLLLDRDPWYDLAPFFDQTLMIDVPENELKQRLTARWQGYRLSPADIRDKLEANDLPNGRTVRSASRPADLVLTQ